MGNAINFRDGGDFDLVCLSHLRWDFVYQRPQHLLSRCARDRRVFFVEEPVEHAAEPTLTTREREGVVVAIPHLPRGVDVATAEALQRELLDELLEQEGVDEPVLWYYTPAAVAFSGHVDALAVVYDCMDELSAFARAPRWLRERERELLARADLVFTGGASLWEAKRRLHDDVHLFPSSVDREHFAQARAPLREPRDQAAIARPRLGFAGVIDERMDLELLAALADLRPDWQLVMVGPVVKISHKRLPRRPNVHYLAKKPYERLPAYLAGWDVALLPFARNEATRFISPTKTPEYLAAGLPVVSTSIRDVVRPYGELGLVRIADEPEAFAAAVEAALHDDRGGLLGRADELLAQTSWERTWRRMRTLVEAAMSRRRLTALMPD